MTLDQLGATLRRMYDDAPQGHKVANIHLFAIKYASAIEAAGVNAREVVAASGLPASYLAEIHKGITLSHYVVPRPAYQD